MKNTKLTSDISLSRDSQGYFTATHKYQGLLIDSTYFETRTEARREAVLSMREIIADEEARILNEELNASEVYEDEFEAFEQAAAKDAAAKVLAAEVVKCFASAPTAAEKAAYLRKNPEVGTIIRDGVEIFYRFENGDAQEFSPASVLG